MDSGATNEEVKLSFCWSFCAFLDELKRTGKLSESLLLLVGIEEQVAFMAGHGNKSKVRTTL